MTSRAGRGGEFNGEFKGKAMGIQGQKREFRIKEALEVVGFSVWAPIRSAFELPYYNIR